MKQMTAKTEAALKTILLALVTAPAGELTEPGEMTQAQLENLKGVGIAQINALSDRGILAYERRGGTTETEGDFAGQTFGYKLVYWVA